jgi:hypothetical protein
MNLAACATFPTLPDTGTWYRAVEPRHLPSALATSYTTRYTSRFSPGPAATPPFEILYLAENSAVALFEVGAIFGSPLIPGGIVASPSSTWVVLPVFVNLQAIVNLTDVATCHVPLQTTAQELTGDWNGYASRGPTTRVKHPCGTAPTQELGAAFYMSGRYEGFRTLSAKLPYREVLVVFPRRLQSGSFVRYSYTDSAGTPQVFQIPQ